MSNRSPQDNWVPVPLRWEKEPPSDQQRAAQLLRQLEPVAPLSDLSVARMRRRLEMAGRSESRPGLRSWLVPISAAAAFLLFMELAAAATVATSPALRRRAAALVFEMLGSRSPTAVVSATVAPAESIDQSAASPGLIPATPVAAPAEAPAPVKQVALMGEGDRAPPPRPHRRPSLGNSVGEETAALAQALSRLHAGHDPEGALATFEAYAFEHPAGLLRGEAVVGQIEALLALDRNTEALGLLDAMQRNGYAGVPRVSNLKLVRAELLGKLERCGEAVPALGDFLLSSTPASQRERALIARATCLARLKDPEGSRADFQTYLTEFPNGPYAPRALMELGALH